MESILPLHKFLHKILLCHRLLNYHTVKMQTILYSLLLPGCLYLSGHYNYKMHLLIVPYTRYSFRNTNTCQATTITKCIISYTRYSFRDAYTCQATTSPKCTISYTRYSFRDAYTCQATTSPKCTPSYTRYSFRNINTCQATTIIKCSISYTRYSFRDNRIFTCLFLCL